MGYPAGGLARGLKLAAACWRLRPGCAGARPARTGGCADREQLDSCSLFCCAVFCLQCGRPLILEAAAAGGKALVEGLLDRGADVATKTPVSGSKRKLGNGCAEAHAGHLQVPLTLGVGEGLAKPDASSLCRGWTVPGRP